MFSKFKSSSTSAPPPNPYDNNPITQYFEIGKQIACAGPELVWKIHEGYRKTDGKVSGMFWESCLDCYYFTAVVHENSTIRRKKSCLFGWVGVVIRGIFCLTYLSRFLH